MTIILDASVALKLVTLEPGSDRALLLLDRDEERIAPDWMLAEVANGLANKVFRAELDQKRAEFALQAMPQFVSRFVASTNLLGQSLEIAARIGHAFYDCLYVALAIREDGRVVTADRELVKAASNNGLSGRVELFA